MTRHTKFIIKVVLLGFAFGCAFPLAGTLVVASRSHSSFIDAQKSEPLLWIIDSAPIILAIFSFFIGLAMYRLRSLANELALEAENERQKAVESAKFALLGQMAGGVAHEINNPLQVITLSSSRLRDISKTHQHADLDAINRQLDRIDLVVEKIAQITRGLKSLARSGDSDPLVIHDLSQLLSDAAVLCSAKFRNFAVELRMPDFNSIGIIEVACRPAQLTQVVINLLSNALDAVQGQELQPWVSLDVTSDSSTITVSVTDSGNGIPPAVADKLFLPFFTTKPVGKGTGLGLSISRELVDSHGGVLQLDRTSPNTRFLMRLPVPSTRQKQRSSAA